MIQALTGTCDSSEETGRAARLADCIEIVTMTSVEY